MSIPAMNWALRQIEKNELSASERLILLVLAFKLHSITKQCTPSIKTIAKMTGLCERRVQMNVRTLEEKQLILVKKRSKKGQQLSNQYELLGATKKAPPQKIAGATGVSPDKEVTSYPVIDDGDFNFPSQKKKKREI